MSLDTAIIQQYYAGILRLTPSAATINAYAQLPSYEAAMDAMMNAAVSSVNPITKLYQAAFDRVPDSAGLTNYTAAYGAGAGTMTLKQIANQWTSTVEFTTDYPASMPNADYVGLLYWNVLHRAADPVGAANFTTALNSGKLTRADVLLELSQSPEFDLRIDGHIRGFQEQAALNNPAAYTGTLWDKVPVNGGDTYTLTTAIETVPATGEMASGATVNGVVQATPAAGQTFQTGDTINGNATSKLDVIIGDGTGAAIVATVKNMGAVNFNTYDTQVINAALFSGVGAVNSVGATADLTVNNGQIATVYGLDNIDGAGDLTVDIRATDITGTADTLNLRLGGVVNGTLVDVDTANNAGIENVSIATSGTNTFVLDRAANAQNGTLTVTGTGVNTIDIGAELVNTAVYNATGGTNTLAFGGAALGFLSGVTVNGFTGVRVLEDTTGNVVFTGGANLSTIRLNGDGGAGNTTSIALTGAGSPSAINLVGTGTAGATDDFGAAAALTLVNAYTGAADTVAVNVSNGGTTKTGVNGYTIDALSINGAETVNVTVSELAVTGVTTLNAGSITSNALSSLKVTTPGVLATDATATAIVPGTATLSTLDFSGVAGAATLGGNTVGTITTVQTLNMANGGVINGSVGAFTAGFDGIDFTTAAGDKAVTFNGQGGVDTVDVTGSTANFVINGGAGNDVLTSGAASGDATINGGAGADTIAMGANANGVVARYTATTDGGAFVAGSTAPGDVVTGFSTTVDDIGLGGAFVAGALVGTTTNAVTAIANAGGINFNTNTTVASIIAGAAANTDVAGDLVVLADLQAAIGALANEAVGQSRIFIFNTDGHTASALYQFTSVTADNVMAANELTLLGTFTTDGDIVAADVVFG